VKVEFSNNALKFLRRLNSQENDKIRKKLSELVLFLETYQYLPFKEFAIKKLKGNWKPKKRMRIGKIRIIFDYFEDSNSIKIYEIDYRGNIYD
jgi:mRNA-degrading endonuclease RelE of RelBE toxin-antitoxin system